MLVCGVLLLLPDKDEKMQYFRNEGFIFGTQYVIQYQAEEDCHDAIKTALQEVDNSLSMFNAASVVSKINRNEDVTTDEDFEAVYAIAHEVAALTQGAFDITVAPLVNAWGFGFKHKETITDALIDSLLPLVAFQQVTLLNHRITKADECMMLDMSAVAKGYACDKVANLLRKQGVHNLLVDIGGEVVAEGTNSRGEVWSVGITKPIDDVTGKTQELQEIIKTEKMCMATSGNYRNFYYEGAERRSHTIDPRTGYPVQHNLLSATVTASSCGRADALATACMVLGAEEALRMIEATEDAECYLIVADGDENKVLKSKGFEGKSEKK